MPVRVLILVCFFLNLLQVTAQKADSIQFIEGIEIKADRVSVFSAGIKIEKMDSTTLAIRQGVSLATLLSEQSPVFLRSYGPGGISTLSVRGTNSSQSGVFWNGINLSQPNMGMTDLSRISTFHFSDIALQSGGASALLGSGVIGGSLQLSNPMKYSTPLSTSVFVTGANTGKAGGATKAYFGSKRMAYVGSLAIDYNRNNFWFTTFDGKRKRLEHALSTSISTIHQVEYSITPKQRLSAGIWIQATNRLIPPTMTMTSNDQKQMDQAFRSSLQWAYSGSKQSFILRSAFVDEKEYFESKKAGIDALYHLRSFQAEAEFKRRISKLFTFGSGLAGHIVRADIADYQGVRYQPDASLWMAIAFSEKSLGIKSALNLRQDFSKGFHIPFCPSWSAEIPWAKWVTSSFAVSRNFRVPTMNDRYWIPGGNPDLKPEDSWNMEAGVELNMKSGDLVQSKIKINFYNLLINNFIQWIPAETNIWTPANVQKVWSRGIEISSRSDLEYVGFKGYFRLGYTYSPSTQNLSTPTEATLTDMQLIYIPLHKVQETFFVSKGTYYTMFSYSLTGKRFIQSDNLKSLPAYALFDAYAGTTITLRKKVSIRVQLELKNIFNTTYQSVQYYPEPGRSITMNLLISL